MLPCLSGVLRRPIYVGQQRNSVANWTVDCAGGVLHNSTLSKNRLEFDPNHLKDNGKTLIGASNKDSKGQILFVVPQRLLLGAT